MARNLKMSLLNIKYRDKKAYFINLIVQKIKLLNVAAKLAKKISSLCKKDFVYFSLEKKEFMFF